MGQSEVKISYEKSKDFKFIPATGAFGGPNPQGEIICNFFIEHREFPKESKMLINSETGKVEEQIAGDPGSMVRELQIGVIMKPDIARTIGKWLIGKADQLKDQPPIKDQPPRKLQ